MADEFGKNAKLRVIENKSSYVIVTNPLLFEKIERNITSIVVTTTKCSLWLHYFWVELRDYSFQEEYPNIRFMH